LVTYYRIYGKISVNDYLSISQASDYCGKAPTTLRNAIRVGKLPSTRIVGKIVVKRGDVDEYCRNVKRGKPRKDSPINTSEEP
jgi:hypothetical protein